MTDVDLEATFPNEVDVLSYTGGALKTSGSTVLTWYDLVLAADESLIFEVTAQTRHNVQNRVLVVKAIANSSDTGASAFNIDVDTVLPFGKVAGLNTPYAKSQPAAYVRRPRITPVAARTTQSVKYYSGNVPVTAPTGPGSSALVSMILGSGGLLVIVRKFFV